MFLCLTIGGLFGIAETAAGICAASLIAGVLALGAGVGASLYGPAATPSDAAYFEAMRRPDGETLFDQAQARATAAEQRANEE